MHNLRRINVRVLPNVLVRYIQKKPISVSFDVTNKCNAKCKYCYYYSGKLPVELSDSEMIHHIKQVAKSNNFFHATFIGGEPTLRLPVLREGVRLFSQSWINTNGLNGFPSEVKPSAWILSLDGPEEYHDKIKGVGAFKKVLVSLQESSSPVISNTMLTGLNKKYLEKFADIMSKTSLKGIIFSFYTQIKGKEGIFHIEDNERVDLIRRILKLRKEYPKFIFFTSRMGYYHNPNSGLKKWNDSSICPVAKYGLAYGVDGRQKNPCAMGDKTVCARCGCGMNSIFLASMNGDISSLGFLYKML